MHKHPPSLPSPQNLCSDAVALLKSETHTPASRKREHMEVLSQIVGESNLTNAYSLYFQIQGCARSLVQQQTFEPMLNSTNYTCTAQESKDIHKRMEQNYKSMLETCRLIIQRWRAEKMPTAQSHAALENGSINLHAASIEKQYRLKYYYNTKSAGLPLFDALKPTLQTLWRECVSIELAQSIKYTHPSITHATPAYTPLRMDALQNDAILVTLADTPPHIKKPDTTCIGNSAIYMGVTHPPANQLEK